MSNKLRGKCSDLVYQKEDIYYVYVHCSPITKLPINKNSCHFLNASTA